jgi:hypothetical protein
MNEKELQYNQIMNYVQTELRGLALKYGDKTLETIITTMTELDKENQRYKQALEEIADSREGSFQATTGEGHNKCVWIAKDALK